jgi:5-(aminomethyl)-3-furanmethanol phosphate kinase
MDTDLVVKVGGSLFDLPDLGCRLQCWLEAQTTRRILLVPGGGATVDLVRQADAFGQLGEERSHWLALRALQFTGHLLASRLPGGYVIEEIEHREQAWAANQIPILDMYAFALADEARPDHLPHRWAVTSDSLAARAAVVADLANLVLLKSCALPDGCDWEEAARRGVVDAAFPNAIASIGCRLNVVVVNLSEKPPLDPVGLARNRGV